MRLQTSTKLAIYAAIELAADAGRQQSVSAMGEKFGVSSLVQAVRGVGGGYQFSANPRRTTLYNVIRLFEEIGGEEREPEATPESLALGDVLHEIDDIAIATLGSITIATMCKSAQARRTNGAAPRPNERTSV
jgi:DNA-binding IscR family transcriptional regulator